MYIYVLWSADESRVHRSPNPNKYVIQHIWIKCCITEKKAEEIIEKQAMTILSYKNEVLNSAALTFIWNINYFRKQWKHGTTEADGQEHELDLCSSTIQPK